MFSFTRLSFVCTQQDIRITNVTVFVNPYTELEEEERVLEEKKNAVDEDSV